MTLGPIWLKDATFPFVKVISIGNNYYAKEIDKGKNGLNSLLVVSSVIHSDVLMPLIKKISRIKKEYYFYYKLHPNEFNEFKKYSDYFIEETNVQVVKNEQSINRLLSKVDAVLVVQSTVMVEALNAGRRVFVYKVLDYDVMDFLFEDSGISFFEDETSFIEKYSASCNCELPSGNYFVKFDKNICLQLLDNKI